MSAGPPRGSDGRAQAARVATRRGWSVVPMHTIESGRCDCARPDCNAPAKHPRIAWDRYTRARPSEATVRGWWRRWPTANVGVVTGGVSGVVVLDVDPRSGGDDSLAFLVARHGTLPTTVETATGGGGRHLWFRTPHGPVRSRPLAAGVDLKAEGGIAVVPPSVHASGRRYRWVPDASPDDRPVAAMPDWLVALADADSSRAGASPTPPRHAGARTASERAEFAATWARVDIRIAPGDHYYRCPFHDDRHPSLHVDLEQCRWYCFGCGRGGGIGALQRELGDRRPTVPRARLTTAPSGEATNGVEVTLAGSTLVPVVGESAHQSELLAICGGRRHYGGVELRVVASLALGADRIDVSIDDRVVGHLADPDGARYRSLLAPMRRAGREATCHAVIRGGWDRGHGDVGRFGVTLELPAPDEAADGGE